MDFPGFTSFYLIKTKKLTNLYITEFYSMYPKS